MPSRAELVSVPLDLQFSLSRLQVIFNIRVFAHSSKASIRKRWISSLVSGSTLLQKKPSTASIQQQTLSTQTGDAAKTKSKQAKAPLIEDIDEEMLKPIPDDGSWRAFSPTS